MTDMIFNLRQVVYSTVDDLAGMVVARRNQPGKEVYYKIAVFLPDSTIFQTISINRRSKKKTRKIWIPESELTDHKMHELQLVKISFWKKISGSIGRIFTFGKKNYGE